ncbi:nucleotidyltransferase family protein [Calothrix sp. PCC 6303]|uniref:nucleotidyltransferase domain-containing protein n=1 Tax=Calothrix sp. PCC 6303 TaxID=1170562 RepID=UPI00130E3F72|nr:nucleotidyltransferase family protein [Calothrix sp. PCC 6303]
MESYTQSTAIEPNLEIDLIICCARTQVDQTTAKQINYLLQKDLNWGYILEKVKNHHLVPLLYRHLSHYGEDKVPPQILGSLQKEARTSLLNNISLSQELRNILNLFQENSIDVIPLKGLVLAASAYHNLALRQFGDLDIFIQTKDVIKACDLLIAQGYEAPLQFTQLSKESAEEFGSGISQGSYDFIHQEKNLTVELHWSLDRKHFAFPVEFEHVWKRVEEVSLQGDIIPNLSPEDALLFLCMHGSKHCWEKMLWICDIAQLLETYENIDWAYLIQQSYDLGVRRMLLLGLNLAYQLMGTLPPQIIWQQIHADEVIGGLSSQVWNAIAYSPLSRSDEHLFVIKARERLMDKLRYLLGIVMTPTTKDWNLSTIPESLSFLWYFILPIRLIQELGDK